MLKINLLGHLRVEVDGAPLKLAANQKIIVLWAYLLLYANTPVPRSLLCRLLWPDSDDLTARANLRRHLYQLRQLLPPVANEQLWLQASSEEIRWQGDGYWIDGAAFEQASQQSDSLELAVDLYAGELLPELNVEWLAVERTRLHNLYISSLKQLVEQVRHKGSYNQALYHAQQLLASEPLDEAAVRLLMTVTYEMGDRNSALTYYAQFSSLLATELGIEPMPETLFLHQAILNNASLPGSTKMEAATPSQPTRSLPPSSFPLVGREAEVGQLSRLWRQAAQGAGSLVLVSGEAGLGKSRLLAAPLLIPTLAEAIASPGLQRPFEEAVSHSLDLSTFFSPNAVNPLYGGWVAQQQFAGNSYGIIQGVANGGYVPLVLAVVGLIACWRKVWQWGAVGLVFALLALGPHLHLNDQDTGLPAHAIPRADAVAFLQHQP